MNILKVLTDKRIKGNIGEDAVARYLRRKFYRIRERNYVAEGHEADIIAESRKHLCIVEVKARTAAPDADRYKRPAAAVTPEKMRSVISVAKAYLSYHPTKKAIRFDVAEVYLSNERKVIEINYIEGAFTKNDAYAERK